MTIPESRNVPDFELQNDSYYFSNALTLKLIKAVEKNDLVLAQKLVADGANPNDVGPKDNPHNQFSVIHILIAKNKPKAIQTLMQVGAKIDSYVTIGSAASALHFAMNLDRIEVLSEMFQIQSPKSLNQDVINSLFFRCVSLGRARVIKLLIDHGISIDILDTAGYSPLMRAIGALDFELAEWLITRGASLDIEAVGGVTAAYAVEHLVHRFVKGDKPYKAATQLMELMKSKGVTFPATPPNEIRARRSKKRS